ncbi:DEAD/DEAH box helicase [Candidatus Dependentiae bacterium]|nr:DEAD/DEAH box helicase [Candidatus Dependentiae bacterium]
MNIKFKDLGLSKDLLKAISIMGFKETTPIQSKAIPEILKGGDIIGLAATGTGKTAAFGIPAIEKVDVDSKDVQILVLCPTRELAMQVADEMNKFLKFKKESSVLAVYGGQSISRQINALRRKPQIIIGTPGRILDHLERGTLKINKIKMLVLDEADRMLDMGFRKDIKRILSATKKNRQTLLFSATMSREILNLTRSYQKNPKTIKIDSNELNKLSIEQFYLNSEPGYKIDFLMDLINKYDPELSIVFCNTKRKVDKIAKTLKQTGFSAAGIHGDMRQSKRDSIMNRFRKNKIKILVATDVAARGIDVDNVQAVFNFEIPRETDSYIHRIGRTGRAGKSGKAFSFVSKSEKRLFEKIIKYTKSHIKEYSNQKDNFSSRKKIVEKKNNKEKLELNCDGHLEKKANKVLKKVEKNITKHEHAIYLEIAQNFISKKCTHKDLSAALLKILIEEKNNKLFRKYN